jgi:hypothetical protein
MRRQHGISGNEWCRSEQFQGNRRSLLNGIGFGTVAAGVVLDLPRDLIRRSIRDE